MHLKSQFFLLIISTFLATSVHAQENYSSRHLTAQEIQRIKEVKMLLDGIDTKSLRETIVELEKSRHPEINLEMKEAMAKTYADIVLEINVKGQKKKEWLYSMVCLNMAYLQFGGEKGIPWPNNRIKQTNSSKINKIFTT